MAKYYLDDTGVQALVGETKEYVSGAVSEHANDSTAHLTSTEKTKLGNIEDGANKTITDSSLSSSSTNPVQNKVVNSALSGKVPTTRTVNGKALSANISLSASDVGADASGTANTAVSNHNTSTSAHNDIRELITGLTTRLNTLADSDDTTLDQMSEVVAYIKANKELIESITTSKVNVADIVNNLTTNVSTKPLSAAQGVAIKALIDALQTEVDAKALASDLTSHTGNTSNPHSVTKSQVGLGNVENVSVNNHAPTYSDTTTLTTLTSGEKLSAAFPKIKLAITNLISHIANVSNPHSVTKSQVGLSNVPNVTTNNQTPTYTEASSNAALVSGETLSTAFGKIAKAISSLISHLANTSNPHGVTKSQVGLGNVENKSSATIRGELTKANVTTALGYTPPETDTVITVDSALSSTSTNPVQNKVINTALSNKANSSHGNHVPKTETANNAKFLRNDNTWATVTPANIGAATSGHTHSSYANQNAFSNVAVGNTTIAADSTTDTLTLVAGDNVTLTADATNDEVTIAAKDTVYTHPTTSGNKHIPSGGSSGQILRWSADGTAVWGADNNTTYSDATQSTHGLMSTADKIKLDGIKTGANKITVDSALSSTSTNPVQNKVINSALSGKANTSHGNHVPTTETANNAKFLRNDNTWATVTPANIGAAATSHGNHVPATETANNAKFLRNDNTWQTVTPANIGAAASSHNHGAGEITSGTLPVARGGTGKSTLTSGQVLVGNGTGAVSQRAIDTTAGGTSGSTNLITSGAVYTGLSNMISDDVTASDIAAIVV